MERPRLLLIEHDVALQTVLLDAFVHAGYDVAAAVGEHDMLSMLDSWQPDVAVIGGGARGTFVQGWSAAHALKARWPVLPLIMLSTNARVVAEAGQTERGRLFAAGLLKPCGLEQLLAVVEQNLQHQRNKDRPRVLPGRNGAERLGQASS
jgi:DNA-binding response OmpR family regulator